MIKLVSKVPMSIIHICILNALLLCVYAKKDYLTEKPEFIKQCKLADPSFEECFKASNVLLFEQFKRGLPGVPDLDPMLINKVKIKQGTNAINMNLDLSDVKAFGFNDSNVVDSWMQIKEMIAGIKLFLPKMTIVGNYELEGKILLIPLKSSGSMTLEIEDSEFILVSQMAVYERHNLTFFNVTSVKIDYNLKHLKVHFNNLFNGNKELEDSTNDIFNDNWQALDEALKPVVKKFISEVMGSYLRKVFNSIPAKFFIIDVPTPRELYGPGNV